MTQTNTYQALCDSVGAYEKKVIDCKLGGCQQVYKPCDTICCQAIILKNYPPKSADQRERLEELILNLGRLSYHKNDIYYICILSRVNNANNGMAGTRPDALYALTHKLVAEGVLIKEEVKEVLNG